MFWLLFGACGSLFIQFKLQENAFLLLPELGQASEHIYVAFYVVLGVVMLFRVLAVLLRIIEQASCDVYCIDFETPNFETKTVNAWRHVFITNEFNELQTSFRYINPETTFIWFIFMWTGFGWENLSQSDPVFTIENNPLQGQNPMLKFFTVSLLFICIGGAQFIYINLKTCVCGAEINSFVDLCTIANISMVILKEHLYGYYLHAKAPWHASDIPLEVLQRELQKEKDGEHGKRALKAAPMGTPGSEAIQSF